MHAHLGLCLSWVVCPHHAQCALPVLHAPSQKEFSQRHWGKEADVQKPIVTIPFLENSDVASLG